MNTNFFPSTRFAFQLEKRLSVTSMQDQQALDPKQSESLNNLQQQLWHHLSATDNWHSWLLGMQKVVLTDDSDLGRGSSFKIQRAGRWEDWCITHWQPNEQIDLNVISRSAREGYRIVLSGTKDSNTLLVCIEAEVEFYGIAKILAPWRLRAKKAVCASTLTALGRLVG